MGMGGLKVSRRGRLANDFSGGLGRAARRTSGEKGAERMEYDILRSTVRYRMAQTAYPRRWVILGESGEGGNLAVIPHTQNEESVRRLVDRLNGEQIPLQEAWQRMLQEE